MKAREIMIQDVFYAKRNDLVRDVLQKFSIHNIGGMPVVDDEHHIVGYISDGDIMRYLGKHYGNIIPPYLSFGMYYVADTENDHDTDDSDNFGMHVQHIGNKNVMEIARRRVTCISPDDDIVHVAELLAKKNIKKVPVLYNGVLVGIVSRGDVVKAVVHRFLPA